MLKAPVSARDALPTDFQIELDNSHKVETLTYSITALV